MYVAISATRLSATQALIKANRLLCSASLQTKLYLHENRCRGKLNSLRDRIDAKKWPLFPYACLVLLKRVLQNSFGQRQTTAVINHRLRLAVWAWHTYRADRLKAMIKSGRYHYRSALGNSHGAFRPMPFKSARRRLCNVCAPSVRTWSDNRAPARLLSSALNFPFLWHACGSLQFLDRLRRRKGTALCFGWMCGRVFRDQSAAIWVEVWRQTCSLLTSTNPNLQKR